MWEKKRSMSPLPLAVLFFAASLVTAKPLLEIDGTPEYRLNGNVNPESYTIHITPNFQEGNEDFNTFDGIVTIKGKVGNIENDLKSFIIHVGQDIHLERTELGDSSGQIISEVTCTKDDFYTSTDKYEGNDLYNCLILNEELTLKKGEEINIVIVYNSIFPTGMHGFYKSYYTHKNKEKVLLTTQFEPTHARKAFPCFDEPSMKATFTLSLTVPEGYEAISNSEIETPKPGNRVTTFTFKPTPKMSTYLLAFIVYEKESYTSSVDSDKKFATYGRKSEIESQAADLSQTYGPKILEKMGEYTNIKYTLDSISNFENRPTKVDQAAIPDFSAGAMENWGLVTYREVALLFKEGKHSESARKKVIEVIGHELAHQWFGNLVTTYWWNSLWLNEGFATYFEYYLTKEALEGEDWRMDERFLVDEQMGALSVDAVKTAAPLTIKESDVQTTKNADEHFGTISYSKGGSVIRMFEDIIGSKKFQSNLQNYLLDNAGEAVKPEKLFEKLADGVTQEETGLDEEHHGRLKDILESWTTQIGFPLLQVRRQNGHFVISQSQFLLDGVGENKYNVKLTYTSNQKDFEPETIWLHADDEGDGKEIHIASDNWILVKTTGYFRVNYDTENWEALIRQLHQQGGENVEKLILPLEHAVLLDNALTLARTENVKYALAINVLSTLEHELDFIPWYAASRGLNFLHRMLVNSKKDEDNTLNNYILSLLEHVYNNFEQNKPVSHIDKVHHAIIFDWACRTGHKKCLDQAQDLFPKYLELTEKNLNMDIINTVYCYTVKTNDTAWLQLWDNMLKEEDATIRAAIISALGCTSNKLALHMYLETVISGNTIRAQDTANVFFSVYSNPDGIDVCLEYLERRVLAVADTANTALNAMNSIINGIASYLTTEEQKARLKKIGETEDLDTGAKSVIETALSTVETNIQWKNKFEDHVLEAMKDALPSTGSAWFIKPVTVLIIAMTLFVFIV